jgi:hypothetical protein
MDFTPSEIKSLLLLAKEWDHSGPPGILDISWIVTALDQAPSDTFDALKKLFNTGLIDMNSLETAAFLTPEGYAAAEHPA